MSRLSEWFSDEESGRSGAERYLWAAVLGILKEVGEELIDELADGLQEYIKESKTPDGWTRVEFLSYAIGRLTLLKEEKIGPYAVDAILDMGIASLVKYLSGKLESDAPVETPEDPAPIDPYYPTTYGPDADIDTSRLFSGDLVYKSGLNRFVIPGRWKNYALYAMAAQGATLITIIGKDD